MAKLGPEYVIASLVQRGVPEHVAQGVVMNFQDESGLNTGIQEQAPTSGRGGFGLAQWTGPRRVALEHYARATGRSVDDPEMQLDFFMDENAGPEAAAWKQVMASPTAQDAAVAFVRHWERPASQHAALRSARYAGGTAPPVSPYALASSGGGARAGTPAPAAKPTQDKYAKAASGALKGLAEMRAPVLGAGGNAPQLPAQAPLPMEAMPIVAGDGQGRDDLAMLMARLNSLNNGTLWG
jgi:hypothetical protein